MNDEINRKAPPFSVVLVNYKTRELTAAALGLLKEALAGFDAQVWVVDNYSEDDSTQYLRSLDWIQLIERSADLPEPGYVAHGRALDLVLEKINTDYLFLLHTDTLIYDAAIFDLMLAECLANERVMAVGCVEQINRGVARTIWRFVSRFCGHYFRRLKISLGLNSREPKPYREIYLKSFCALWNAKAIKQHGLSFYMNDRIPGYEIQDRLTPLGYTIVYLPARTMFRYLDHVESGTVSAIGGYGAHSRRLRKYHATLEKIKNS